MLKIVLKRMKMSEISGGLRPLDPHRGLQPLDPACGGSAPYTPAGLPPNPLTRAVAPGPGHPGRPAAEGREPPLKFTKLCSFVNLFFSTTKNY